MHMIWGGGFLNLVTSTQHLLHARRFTNVNAFNSQNNPTSHFAAEDTGAQLPQLVSGITGVPPRQSGSPAVSSQGWGGHQTPFSLQTLRRRAWALCIV